MKHKRKTAKCLNGTHRVRNLQIHMTIEIGRVTVRMRARFPKGNYDRNNV